MESEKVSNIQRFKDAVYKFQKEVGLNDWEINLSAKKNAPFRASCTWDAENRIATISYETTWLTNKNTLVNEIHRVAYHEIMELFMWSISEKLDKHYSSEVSCGLVHKIIRYMENVKFGNNTEI